MLDTVRFTCTALSGTNKVGNLKVDDRGYYLVVLGALDVYNSAGQFYTAKGAKDLFEKSSLLVRRAQKGVLRSEYGHPKPTPGMSDDDFAYRCLQIYETQQCCHIREVYLDFENVVDPATGKPIIAIMGWISPSGPYGPALEKQLKNPDENVCFSIRAFTDDYREHGVTKRVLKNIVTWDYVNEPGIAVANKYMSPTLEEYVERSFTRETLLNVSDMNRGKIGMAHESTSLSLEDLFTSMGWQTQRKSKITANLRW